jgi:hypothetical protein
MVTSEKSGIIILLIGIVLMLTTFIIASFHLQGNINALTGSGSITFFGETLNPFIETAIYVLYLGLMGWIASKVTARGIALLLQVRLLEKNGIKKQQNRVSEGKILEKIYNHNLSTAHC